MVVPDDYIPQRGDVVWINLNPQAGHEQAGRRPAVVLSPMAYNRKTGLALFCPITNQEKGYPFEVAIPVGLPVSGVILADQVKSLDWKIRDIERLCAIPSRTVAELLQKIILLLSK
jgi:mRNA interferase MazF